MTRIQIITAKSLISDYISVNDPVIKEVIFDEVAHDMEVFLQAGGNVRQALQSALILRSLKVCILIQLDQSFPIT